MLPERLSVFLESLSHLHDLVNFRKKECVHLDLVSRTASKIFSALYTWFVCRLWRMSGLDKSRSVCCGARIFALNLASFSDL